MEAVHFKGISKASAGISKTRTFQSAYRKIPGLKWIICPCNPSLLSMQDGRLGGASDRSTKGVGTESKGMYLFSCGQVSSVVAFSSDSKTVLEKTRKERA